MATMREFFNSSRLHRVRDRSCNRFPAPAPSFITTTTLAHLPLPAHRHGLYLKKLIVGGFDGDVQFGKNFRNERHGPARTTRVHLRKDLCG